MLSLGNMKVKPLSLLVLASISPLLVSAVYGIDYKVRTATGGVQNYRLEVPAGAPAKYKPDPQVLYSPYNKTSQQSAQLVAVAWAGGTHKDKPALDNYPNSLTDVGGKPGGFYNASNVKVDSVQYLTTPVPYYLVQMSGQIGPNRETLYAAVLENGAVVRPVPISGGETGSAHPAKRTQRHHR
jgi:hypothetical protein